MNIPFVLWWDLETPKPRQWNQHQELRCFTQMLCIDPSDLTPFEFFGPRISNMARKAFFINGHKRAILKKTPKLLEAINSIGPVELLVIDGCNMASVEFLLAFSNFAKTFIVSLSSIPVVGLPYASLFGLLREAHDHSPFDVARLLAKSAYRFFGSHSISSKYRMPVCILVIESSSLQDLFEQVMSLYCRYLIAGGSWDDLCEYVRRKTESSPDEPQQQTLELGTLLIALAERLGEEDRLRIQQLILDVGRQVALEPQSSSNADGFLRLSIDFSSMKSLT